LFGFRSETQEIKSERSEKAKLIQTEPKNCEFKSQKAQNLMYL
jgi:hypothetical protein